MKKFSFLVFVLTIFITFPSYSNESSAGNSSSKTRKRFEMIDKNADGLLSKSEMMTAQKDRIDKLFTKFDKNGDSKLSRKELREVRKQMKKRIIRLKNDGE